MNGLAGRTIPTATRMVAAELRHHNETPSPSLDRLGRGDQYLPPPVAGDEMPIPDPNQRRDGQNVV